MSNAKIAEALAMINREIASEEERHQTLLAEAATVGKSIEEMQKAVKSLEALIGDSGAKRQPAGKARKSGKPRSAKGRTRKTAGGYDKVAPTAVLAAITGSGEYGVKRSALSGLLANRKGEEPTKKALDEALQSLFSEMSIRRDGYRFVAVGEPASGTAGEAPEAAPEETATLFDDGVMENSGDDREPAVAQPAGDPIVFEEDPATGETEEPELTASGGGRRGGRPRKPVSDEVAQAMAEVAGVITRAGKEGCKMSVIRAGVQEVTGVALSTAEAKRAVMDLLRDGRIQRDKYRYVAT